MVDPLVTQPRRWRTVVGSLIGVAVAGAAMSLRLAGEGTLTLSEGLGLFALVVIVVLALVFGVLALQHLRARRRVCDGTVVATTASTQSVSGRFEVLGDSVHWHPTGRRKRQGIDPVSLHLVDLAGAALTRGRWSATLDVPLANGGHADLGVNPFGARRVADALAAGTLVRVETARPLWRWLGPAMMAVVVLETVVAFQVVDPGPFDAVPLLPRQRSASALPDELFLGNPPGSETVIERTDAAKVALAVRDARLDAIEARQLDDVRAVTTGLVRWDGVVAVVTGDPLNRASGVSVHDVLVPPGGTYPATFLAVLTWNHDAGVSSRVQVFERRDEASPWRVALSTGYEGPPLVLNDPSAPGAVAKPRELHGPLADYYRSWKEVRRPPADTAITPGVFTSEAGSRLAAVPQDGDYGRGIRLHAAFGVADDVWAFDIPDGHLECGAVWYVMDYDGARQVRDRSNWGNELAPGHYDWIREAEPWMSCVLERDDGALVVFGGDGGRAIVRASGGGIDPAIVEVSEVVPGLDDPPYWR